MNYYKIHKNKTKRKNLYLTFDRVFKERKPKFFKGFETLSGNDVLLILENGSILGKAVY